MEIFEIIELLKIDMIEANNKVYIDQYSLDNVSIDLDLPAWTYEKVLDALAMLKINIIDDISVIENELEIDAKIEELKEVEENFIEIYEDIDLDNLTNEQVKKIEQIKSSLINAIKPVGKEKGGTGVKDYTKYVFDGKTYNKGRLVLAVIKDYVRENKPTVAELKRVFYKSLQGSYGVVSGVLEALAKTQSVEKRFFTNNDEIISLVDGDLFVCSQWKKENIDKFIKVANACGYLIEEI